jgi:hypothetical protein
MRSIAVHLFTSRQPRRRGRPDLDFATVDKIDRGIGDDAVAVFDAGLTLTALSKSRATVTGQTRAMPPSTTATLRQSPLKTIASDGTISDGVFRGIFSLTVQ